MSSSEDAIPQPVDTLLARQGSAGPRLIDRRGEKVTPESRDKQGEEIFA